MNAHDSVLRMNAGKSFLVAKIPASGTALLMRGSDYLNLVGVITTVLIAVLVTLAAYIGAAAISAEPSLGIAQTSADATPAVGPPAASMTPPAPPIR